MKRHSSSVSSEDVKFKVSQSELQQIVQEVIERERQRANASLDALLERLHDNGNHDDAIQHMQADIQQLQRRGEAAFTYLKQLGFPRTHTEDQPASCDSPRSALEEDVTHLSQVKPTDQSTVNTLEKTQQALERVSSDHEMLKAAMSDSEVELSVSPPMNKVELGVSPTMSKVELSVSPPMSKVELGVSPPKSKEASYGVVPQGPLCIKLEPFCDSSVSVHPECEKQAVWWPPLPPMPFPSILPIEAASFNIPQRLTLQLALIRTPPGLSLLWNVEDEDPSAPPMDSYSVYMAVEGTQGSGVLSEWRRLGEVRAIPLPMCVMLGRYKPGFRACFSVVGRDTFGRYGPHSRVVPALVPL